MPTFFAHQLVIKEIRAKIGKNVWLIPIRYNEKKIGYFVSIGPPLNLDLTAPTVEELEEKLKCLKKS